MVIVYTQILAPYQPPDHQQYKYVQYSMWYVEDRLSQFGSLLESASNFDGVLSSLGELIFAITTCNLQRDNDTHF